MQQMQKIIRREWALLALWLWAIPVQAAPTPSYRPPGQSQAHTPGAMNGTPHRTEHRAQQTQRWVAQRAGKRTLGAVWPDQVFPLQPHFRRLQAVPKSLEQRAYKLWRRGEVAGAVKLIEQAAKKWSVGKRERALLSLAHQLMSFADAPRAKRLYRRLMRSKRTSISMPARLMLARHALQEFRAKAAYAAMARWPKRAPSKSLARMWLAGWWLRGVAASQSGKSIAAHQSFVLLVKRGTVLADTAALARVKLAMRQRAYRQVGALAGRYLKKWKRGNVASQLRRLQVRGLEREGKHKQALKRYKRLARTGSTSAQMGVVRCQIKLGQRKAAIRGLLRLLQRKKGGWVATRAARMLRKLGYRATLPSIQYSLAYQQYRRGQFKPSIVALSQLVKKVRKPKHKKLRARWEPKALYLRSRAQFRIKEYTKAAKGISFFLRRYPRHRSRLSVELLQIRNRYRQRKDLATALQYERFAMKHLGTSLGRKALWWAAQLIFEHGKTKRATRLFKRYAQLPSARRRSEAGLKVGLIAYQQKQYAKVQQALQSLQRRGGRFGARALFWGGKAYLKRGKKAQAKKLFRRISPFAESYYAARARQYTEKRPILAKRHISLYQLLSSQTEEKRHKASMRRWLKLRYPGQTMDKVAAQLMRSKGYQKALLFALAGHTRALRQAMRDLARRPKQVAVIYLLARAWAAFGDPNRTLYTAGLFRRKIPRSRRKGLPFRAMLRLLYPVPYPAIYMRYGKKYNLRPLLMVGLTRQESLFNPLIVSGAGARGIAQIMPKEGKKMAKRWGIRGYRLQHLFRPQLNLRMGFHHFRAYLNKHGNNVALTFAAYNAGPVPLKRWIKANPTLPTRDIEAFIEYGIGYRETRMYVRYCLRWYNMYRFAFTRKRK